MEPPARRLLAAGRVAVVALVLLTTGACSWGALGRRAAVDPTSTTPVALVATTTQVADFARVIGGDCATVHEIVPPNVDPHDYEPSPADIDALARAEVVVENGVGLEHWLKPTLDTASSSATVVDTSQGVALRHGEGGAADPHIWFDPRNAEHMVATIERALVEARPGCQAGFARRMTDYTAQLQALDADIAASIATLTSKKLVTNHDAFGYYVDRYGLDFVGSVIPSFDSSAELSANQLADLVSRIRAEGVRAVFSETSLPAKAAATIAREAGVTVVAGPDGLYGDSLGPAGSPGGTYLEMMRHDTETIVANLR